MHVWYHTSTTCEYLSGALLLLVGIEREGGVLIVGMLLVLTPFTTALYVSRFWGYILLTFRVGDMYVFFFPLSAV